MGNDLTNIGTIAIGSNTANQVFQINERLTWVKGRHQLKFGGSLNRYNMQRYYSGNNGQLGFIQYNGAFTGVAFADFLLDKVQSKGRGSLTSPWTHQQNRVAFYAADDFKVTNALTLNLGIRWGYTSPLVEVDDRQANIDLSNAELRLAGGNGNSRALYEPYYNGWEPRFGLAYRASETVGVPRRLRHHAVHGRHRRQPAAAAEPAVLLRVAEHLRPDHRGQHHRHRLRGSAGARSAVGRRPRLGSEPAAAVHPAVEPVRGVPDRLAVVDQHRLRRQQVEPPGDPDRRQPAAARRPAIRAPGRRRSRAARSSRSTRRSPTSARPPRAAGRTTTLCRRPSSSGCGTASTSSPTTR